MIHLANLFMFSLNIVVSRMNVLIITHIAITKNNTAGVYLVSLIFKCKLYIVEGKDNKYVNPDSFHCVRSYLCIEK